MIAMAAVMDANKIIARATYWTVTAFAVLAAVTAQAQAYLFVTSQSAPTAGEILRYNQADGSFAGAFASAGATDPLGLTFGRDGNLYVAGGAGNYVMRYDGTTGAYLGVFAHFAEAPFNMTFGPDGNLYVTSSPGLSSTPDQILRYDGTTGALIDTFISDPHLANPRGLTFGPDGDLYVASYNDGTVLRYSPTGAFLGTFVPAQSGGLRTPSDLLFGPDGNLYVTSNSGVLRYNGITGAFMGQFASVGTNGNPADMAYGPDGNLYVTVAGPGNGVLRFNGETGAFIDNFVTPGSGGLGGPVGIAFSPVPEPSTVSLLGASIGFMLARHWRRRARSHTWPWPWHVGDAKELVERAMDQPGERASQSTVPALGTVRNCDI